MIEVGMFCEITSDAYTKYCINKGSKVYVAGNIYARISEEDPYSMREVFICARMDEEGRVLINGGGITVDGLNLKQVSEEDKVKYEAIFKQTFGGDVSNA